MSMDKTKTVVFDPVVEIKRIMDSGKLGPVRRAITKLIGREVEKVHRATGFDPTLYKELADEHLIPDFRMPQANRVYQPGGKGTTVVVELSPTSTLAKRLLEEAQYRYLAVWDYQDHQPFDYEKAHPTRERALQKYLNNYPSIKGMVALGEDKRGPTLHAPNREVELDFVVIAPDGRFHLTRFTDESIGHVCKTLNIAFYQRKK